MIDCVTLWLTNYFSIKKSDRDLALTAAKLEFEKLKTYQGHLIFISNEIGMGLHAESAKGRTFVELQGWMNQHIAQHANVAYFMVSGLPLKIMQAFNISPVGNAPQEDLKKKIDFKTKPIGALGQLESIASQIGLVQQTTSPVLTNPHLLVFAADHGLAREGVSAYPPEVTHQMVLNFLTGGAAINVFARQHDIELKIIDAGVNHNFGTLPGLIDKKIDHGTQNSLLQNAMTSAQLTQAIAAGAKLISEIQQEGTNVVGFG